MVILDQTYCSVMTANPMGFFFISVMVTRADLLSANEMVAAGSRWMQYE